MRHQRHTIGKSRTRNPDEILYTMPPFVLSNIKSVYVGIPDKCMCGCSGIHTYASVNAIFAGKDRGYFVAPEEINDARVMRVYNKMVRNARLGVEVIDNYIYTVVIGKTQYTLYRMRRKKNPGAAFHGKSAEIYEGYSRLFAEPAKSRYKDIALEHRFSESTSKLLGIANPRKARKARTTSKKNIMPLLVIGGLVALVLYLRNKEV